MTPNLSAKDERATVGPGLAPKDEQLLLTVFLIFAILWLCLIILAMPVITWCTVKYFAWLYKDPSLLKGQPPLFWPIGPLIVSMWITYRLVRKWDVNRYFRNTSTYRVFRLVAILLLLGSIVSALSGGSLSAKEVHEANVNFDRLGAADAKSFQLMRTLISEAADLKASDTKDKFHMASAKVAATLGAVEPLNAQVFELWPKTMGDMDEFGRKGMQFLIARTQYTQSVTAEIQIDSRLSVLSNAEFIESKRQADNDVTEKLIRMTNAQHAYLPPPPPPAEDSKKR